MFILWGTRLFEMRDHLGSWLCALAWDERIIFIGAVNGAIDFVERGEGAEGE